MSLRFCCRFALVFAALAWAGPSQAHVSLDYPPMRQPTTRDDQKESPCGDADLPKGTPTVFSPGETITVQWHEGIDHPSHYRLAFDVDGQDDFVDPTDVDDLYNSDAVLVDDLPDEDSGSYTYELTLPNVECETCTLQLVQVMYDRQDGSFDGNYYRCADIALRGAPAPDAGPDAPDAMPPIGDSDAMSGGGGADAMPVDNGGGGDDGGCQVGGSGGGIPAALLLAVVFAGLVLRRPAAPRSPG